MNIEEEILINQYAQDLINIDNLENIFNNMNIVDKRFFLKEFIYGFMIQAKVLDIDIPQAIENSFLKSTYTPCVMIKKGVESHNLEQLVELPENELRRVLLLFLSLFKVAYQRRFLTEKNNPNKWWYWDMSDEENMRKIEKMKDDTLH